MKYTKKIAVDAQPFVSKWLELGRQLINPKEQQDALKICKLKKHGAQNQKRHQLKY